MAPEFGLSIRPGPTLLLTTFLCLRMQAENSDKLALLLSMSLRLWIDHLKALRCGWFRYQNNNCSLTSSMCTIGSMVQQCSGLSDIFIFKACTFLLGTKMLSIFLLAKPTFFWIQVIWWNLYGMVETLDLSNAQHPVLPSHNSVSDGWSTNLLLQEILPLWLANTFYSPASLIFWSFNVHSWVSILTGPSVTGSWNCCAMLGVHAAWKHRSTSLSLPRAKWPNRMVRSGRL